MSDVIVSVEAVEEVRPTELSADVLDEQLIGQLVDRARASGLQLTGEGGLLQQLTKRVLESALEGEITDHLGYEKHDRAGAGSGNNRNGVRAKTVLTDVGPVEIEVPRDREGGFEPQIVKKRQRRLTGVDEMVLSLSARGLTHGDISAHLAEVYGASVSKSTISTITDKVMDGMAEWQNRPLDAIYPVIFIDCIHVKARDGQVANRPIYVALAVTVDGTRDILGLWAGDGGEGAKYWLQVLTEIKNRGVEDVAWSSATASRACRTPSRRTAQRRCARARPPWLRPPSSQREAARRRWSSSPPSSSRVSLSSLRPSSLRPSWRGRLLPSGLLRRLRDRVRAHGGLLGRLPVPLRRRLGLGLGHELLRPVPDDGVRLRPDTAHQRGVLRGHQSGQGPQALDGAAFLPRHGAGQLVLQAPTPGLDTGKFRLQLGDGLTETALCHASVARPSGPQATRRSRAFLYSPQQGRACGERRGCAVCFPAFAALPGEYGALARRLPARGCSRTGFRR